MSDFIQQLSAGVLERNRSNPQARQIAAVAFVDTVACIFAGSQECVVRDLCNGLLPERRPVPLQWPGADCHSSMAALVNGTAAHALEFDDHELIGVTHPSSVLVPALLSLLDQTRSSGEAMLDAYVAGYEAISAVGNYLNPDHYIAGWHSTSTIGALGAVVAAAVLLGCNEEQVAEAIAISCSIAGGIRAQFGTAIKPVHAGLAAQAGVMAALIARSGVTASAGAFDGQFGIATLMAGANRASSALDVTIPKLQDNPPIIKLYPACAATHRSVDGVIDLLTAHDITADEILEITTEIPNVAASALLECFPSEPSAARFSMPYCIACAVEQRSLTLDDFNAAALKRSGIRRLAAIVRLTSYQIDGDPFADGNYRVRTSIKTKSGRRFDDERFHAKGAGQEPVTIEQLRSKFDQCMSYVDADAKLSFDQVMAIGDTLHALDAFTVSC